MRQPLRLGIAALLHQHAGEAHDKSWRSRVVFSLVLQARNQCPAGVCFRLCEPPLLGFHARLIEDQVVYGLPHLAFGRRVLLLQNGLDRCYPAQLGLPVGRFGIAKLAARLQNNGAVEFDI